MQLNPKCPFINEMKHTEIFMYIKFLIIKVLTYIFLKSIQKKWLELWRVFKITVFPFLDDTKSLIWVQIAVFASKYI